MYSILWKTNQKGVRKLACNIASKILLIITYSRIVFWLMLSVTWMESKDVFENHVGVLKHTLTTLHQSLNPSIPYMGSRLLDTSGKQHEGIYTVGTPTSNMPFNDILPYKESYYLVATLWTCIWFKLLIFGMTGSVILTKFCSWF